MINEADSDLKHQEFLEQNGYWGNRGVGAIIYSPKQGKFGFGLRSDAVLEPGTIGTFGGAVDGGESDIEALERELSEEIGYFMPPEAFPLYSFKDKDKDFCYNSYLVIIDDRYFDPALNWENDEIVFLSLEELKKSEKLHFGIEAIIKDSDAINKLIHMGKIREFNFSYDDENKLNSGSGLNF